ncbi:hypothetical protein RRG08_045562 [Elysia crispata]|uniref:Uncharacterized protein n=1 Tax=Elysia crispata TaxID=231223 RepID=A0AAE1AE13_9GAST|nr:hypothetical protein RRG08_045562 [Elysia crispata]
MGIKTALHVVLAVACLAVIVTAGRGNGRGQRRGNRGRHREPRGDRVQWTRTLSDGVTVEETALIASEHDVIIFKSQDNSSESLGFQTSEVYYGFDGDEPIMAISTRGRRRGRPCFLTTPQQSYADLVAALRARNGTTVSFSSTLQLNAQVGSMNNTLARAFSRQNPLMRRVCTRNKYYDTRVQGETVEGEETRLIKTLAAENQVEITFPVVSRQRDARRNRGNRRGRGGRRGNRRGGRRGGRRGERPGRGARGQRRGRRQGRRNRNRGTVLEE